VKVFVAGASGALGRRLVPQLVANGHEVVGMTRSGSKQDLVRELGAQPIVADALDRDEVMRAIAEAEPEAVVHQLTAIPANLNPKRFERDFALTNRLRTEGTDHLLAAARAAGARRFVAQSFTGWPYAHHDSGVKTEDDPLDPEPVASFRSALDAIRHLESAVSGADGIEGLVLRYGTFYGPGTALGAGPEGSVVEMVRKRRFPVVGSGAGVWSSSRSTMPPRPPSPPFEVAPVGSTTSSTTIPPRCRSGCPGWPQRSGRSRPGACHAGSAASRPERGRQS
jgi:nucleoside-diphosphate-sugar epimerase